jgi:RNA polymerase sigma-70 factor, ECF subfamily
MDNTRNDLQLFRRLQSGDRAALNALFARYYQGLCTFAYSFISNHHEAEELVADVFLNIWLKRQTLSITTSVKGYLYSSVRYACLAILKKHAVMFTDIDDIADSMGAQSQLTPENELYNKELKSRIEQIVQSLPQACRQIFILSRFDELSYREISEVFSISEKTVENQLGKALTIVRKQLKLDEEINFSSLPVIIT